MLLFLAFSLESWAIGDRRVFLRMPSFGVSFWVFPVGLIGFPVGRFEQAGFLRICCGMLAGSLRAYAMVAAKGFAAK